MIEKEQIFKHVEYMADKIPCALYWLNLDYIVSGVNDRLLKAIGAKYKNDIIGKTVYGFYPKHIADNLQLDFRTAVETGEDLEREHIIIDITTKKLRYFAATVSPLRDSSQTIIGIIGTSIEVTAEKEAEQKSERLMLENLSKEAEEQKKFRKIADQVAHDIRSPLASLSMLLKSCNTLPEMQRIALRNSTARINDIASNLLNQFKPKEKIQESMISTKSPLLLSTELLEILSEKKYEYQETSIDFEYKFSQADNFAFIDIDVIAFKRSVSNIINNAVAALN